MVAVDELAAVSLHRPGTLVVTPTEGTLYGLYGSALDYGEIFS